MGNYNKDNRSGGRSFGGGGSGGRNFGGGGGGGRNFGGGRDGGRPQMHAATCSECGQECEVPFRPTGDKPVFCRDCFKNKGGDSGSRRSGGGDYGRPSGNFRANQNFEEKRMYQVTCDKCGDECEVPFQPTGGKPIYCSKCFDKSDKGNKGNKGNDFIQFKEQFEMLNIKLDRLIKALMPAPSHVELVKNKAPKATKAPKPEEKAKAKKVSAKKKK